MKLSQRNYQAIKAHMSNEKLMQGSKIEALYNLIQEKGAEVRLNGIENCLPEKCLQISETEYLLITRRFGAKDKFFPCALTFQILTEI